MNLLRQLLKEPLLHFIAAGSVLFAVYGWLDGSDPGPAQGQVRIGEGDLRWLSETWSKQWQRQPSRDELRGLVMELAREELLAREARELGLDRDDTVVRRRLAQKLTFLIEDTVRLADPTEAELRQLYDEEPQSFRDRARVSFVHVFFSPEHRTDAAADARRTLDGLAGREITADAAELGDRSLIQSEFGDADEQTVAAQLGPDFATAVLALQPHIWQGPIRSSYGQHLVQVTGTKPARRRTFEEARTALAERWHEERRREQTERYFDALLEKYEVVLDDEVKSLVGELSGRFAIAQ